MVVAFILNLKGTLVLELPGKGTITEEVELGMDSFGSISTSSLLHTTLFQRFSTRSSNRIVLGV